MTTERWDDQRLDRLATIVESNARAIEAISNDVAVNRADIASTRASVDALVQTITELSIRTEERIRSNEARLDRLDDAVIGIERLLQELLHNRSH